MAAPQRDTTMESALPVVSANGLNTNQNINFNGGSNSCDLPAATTLNGVSISAQGNISGSNTTGATFSVTNTGIYTGVGSFQNIANSATTGVITLIQGNGLTTGNALSISTTGTLTGAGSGLTVTANSATTTNGIVQISGTSLTSGVGLLITGGGSSMTSTGVLLNMNLGAATAGSGLDIVTTGVYTDTTGLLSATANSATTGSIAVINSTGLTSGKTLVLNNTAGTLTTGRYLSANDASLEVFGIGANGHIHTTQTTAPTIATNSTGLSAVAVTAGSTDVCGTITSTGTPASGTVITLTFNKTYTTAPKVVLYTPANAAAGGVNTMPIITQTATTAVFTWPAGGVYAATPSWTYLVVA